MNQLHDHSEAELLGAYVLDALEDAERASFEAHLATCSGCQDEVAELLLVVDLLPLAVDAAEPRSELKQRLLEEITREGTGGRPALTALPASALVGRAGRRISKYEAVWGLVAAVIIAALGIWNVQLQRQVNTQNQSALYQQDVNRAILAGASVSQLTSTSPGLSGQAVVVQPRNGGSPYLLVNSMPHKPSNTVYELWYLRGKSAHRITVFNYSGSSPSVISLTTPTTSYNVAAITVERGPNGTKAPTSSPILAGNLGA